MKYKVNFMSKKTENKMIKNDDSNVNTVNVYSLEKITSKENSQQINIKKIIQKILKKILIRKILV